MEEWVNFAGNGKYCHDAALDDGLSAMVLPSLLALTLSTNVRRRQSGGSILTPTFSASESSA
jgi:hypothetical protein